MPAPPPRLTSGPSAVSSSNNKNAPITEAATTSAIAAAIAANGHGFAHQASSGDVSTWTCCGAGSGRGANSRSDGLYVGGAAGNEPSGLRVEAP